MFDDLELKQHICRLASANGFPGADPEDLQLLALGGSDRRFYRVVAKKTSCIAMVTPPPGDEQQSWLEINRFLHSCSIAAPDVYATDGTSHIILVEDMGDLSLYNALQAAQDRQSVLELYKRALTFLAEMQVLATPAMQSCSRLRNRHFGYAAFRDETDYFIRSFLQEYCRMDVPSGLSDEFHDLALTLSHEPTVFMHRDFQSQNLHLTGDTIKVIDFQTATAGPPHYDLVSLLKDAYFVLSASERSLLLHFYLEERSRLGSPIDDPVSFTHTFHLCGLQRNMQALAAFSFLGTHKKKTRFYAHIPAALNYLADAVDRIDGYPCLCATLSEIKLRLSNRAHLQP
jgi:aminoglycoside/choline kinase family phosphotransferase